MVSEDETSPEPLFLVIGCYVCETNESDDDDDDDGGGQRTLCAPDEHRIHPRQYTLFVSILLAALPPRQTFKKIPSIREKLVYGLCTMPVTVNIDACRERANLSTRLRLR